MASSDHSDVSDVNTRSRTVCALCRQRKTRCDRKLPKCGFCVKAKVECQYLSQPRKRGLRAGYVTELESRIESLERQVEALAGSPQPMTTQVPDAQHQARKDLATPSDHSQTSAATSYPRYIALETDAAVRDLLTLPHSYLRTLAERWFSEEHRWLPILEYSRIQQSLAALPPAVEHIPDVVLRAVIALKIAYSSQAISLGYNGRQRLSFHLRSQVLADAMSAPSIDSIRAMFIIALLDYGSDNIPSTFSIMSMCRRTGENIGIFRQLLQRIESQSPQHVGPPSRDIFVNDNAQIAQTWAILSFDAVSSLGVSWRDVTTNLVAHLSGIAYVSVPDFEDSFVTHVHLAAIGLQPVHDFFYTYSSGEHQDLEGETLTIVDDLYQNLMSYVHGLPRSGYTVLADGAVDFEINQVFTRLLSNAAAIMVYQRYLMRKDSHNLQLAVDRCMESYHQIIDLIRNISDADVEVNSPSLPYFLAVAIRFRIVTEHVHGNRREPLFDVLMHGVNMCGRRWPLARRWDIVFRAALVEVDSGTVSGLPPDFWDLRKSGHDISQALKDWVAQNKQSLWIGSLNGPYA